MVDEICQPYNAELKADGNINALPDDVVHSLANTVNVHRVKSPLRKAASAKF